MHHAEAYKGFVTATATLSGYAWLTDAHVLSTICFVGSVAAAVGGWWMLRKEKQAEAARNKRVEDALAILMVNDVQVAAMISRILHTETVPKPEVKE